MILFWYYIGLEGLPPWRGWEGKTVEELRWD